MLSLLVTLLFMCIILAIFWWILSMIPFPAPLTWIVRVVFAVICLICLLEVMFGGFSLAHILVR